MYTYVHTHSNITGMIVFTIHEKKWQPANYFKGKEIWQMTMSSEYIDIHTHTRTPLLQQQHWQK